VYREEAAGEGVIFAQGLPDLAVGSADFNAVYGLPQRPPRGPDFPVLAAAFLGRSTFSRNSA
jgi:hypothetical protein